MVIEFFALGDPIPQGSMRAFVDDRAEAPRVRVKADNPRTAGWRKTVSTYARFAATKAGLREPSAGPAEVHLLFVMPAPKYLAKRIAKAGHVGRVPCCWRPDLDKLTRAVFDALTDTVWVDDQQCYLVSARKAYPLPGEETGVHVRVTLTEEE